MKLTTFLLTIGIIAFGMFMCAPDISQPFALKYHGVFSCIKVLGNVREFPGGLIVEGWELDLRGERDSGFDVAQGIRFCHDGTAVSIDRTDNVLLIDNTVSGFVETGFNIINSGTQSSIEHNMIDGRTSLSGVGIDLRETR